MGLILPQTYHDVSFMAAGCAFSYDKKLFMDTHVPYTRQEKRCEYDKQYDVIKIYIFKK